MVFGGKGDNRYVVVVGDVGGYSCVLDVLNIEGVVFGDGG